MKTEFLNVSDSFSGIVAKAREIQKDCRDYLVSNAGQKTYMDPDGNLHFLPEAEGMRADMLSMPMSDWSLGQLSTRTGVSKKYIERCFENGRGDLASRNINSWLTETRGDMKIRTYCGGIRGLVSGRYSDYDAPYLLDGLFDGILDESEWTMRGSFINEERLHIRMTQKEPMKLDGGLFPAIFIDSSDVGRSALRIMFGIFRVACTNGLIIPAICTKIHQRHLGVNKDDLLRIVAESVRTIPDMMENAEDLITYARRQKVDLVSPLELEAIIREFKSAADLSEEESKEVIKITQEKYWADKWGLVNGLTEFAQRKNLEQRLKIEEAAGIYLKAA